MRDAIYMNDRTVILNYSTEFPQSLEELLNGKGFKVFMSNYLKNLAVTNIKVYSWLTRGRPLDEMVPEIIRLTKQLLVMELDEISDGTFFTPTNRLKALYIVEEAYNFWRRKQRYAIISSGTSSSYAFNGFMEADTHFNQLVLKLYRTCEEKLQGRRNLIYRQLQAGTNACAVTQNYRWNIFPGYGALKNIPFIASEMLRTPILMHPLSNKREGVFAEVDENPIKTFRPANEYLCYPAKVGDLLCFVYFQRDFIASGMALANLFELANEDECRNHKPDLICLFGNRDDEDRCIFHYDTANDVWVGSVSYDPKIEYFGYIKKMILTLHNVRKLQQGALPLHGSMVDIYFRNNTRRSVVFIGDSGAGKSETIEVLKQLNRQETGDLKIESMDVVFDDMGSMHIVNGKVCAQGTEIGAFVRLDDLDKGTAYRDMERSIFFNPETSNARVVAPISSYELIRAEHPVDMVLYANNYDENVGVHRFSEIEDAKRVFSEGKRMALGTTQEVGMTQTYFANPFGPMQQKQLCANIMDRVFRKLYEDGVYVGEIYTNLGTGHKENLQESGRQLLELLKKM